MSKENKQTPISNATNVAEDNEVQSEFIIISSDGQSELNHGDKPSKTSHEKTKSSNEQKKPKSGVSKSFILNHIKERQEKQRLADLEAEEEEKRNQEEQRKREEEEQERLRLERERREKIKEKEKKRIERKREEGSYLTKEQRKRFQRAQVQLEAAGIQIPTPHSSQLTIGKKRILYDDHRKKNLTSPDASTEPIVSTIELEDQLIIESEEDSDDAWEQVSELKSTNTEEHEGSQSTESSDNDHQFEIIDQPTTRGIGDNQSSSETLRAPVICVLGHVDAGKTTLLDNLRQSSVQINEAGGITQQIGATNVPLETLYERTKMCRNQISIENQIRIPGLLIIDTPGHETFKNLRLRGSLLCDLAILVVDIMDGLAPQTIESIQLLKERNTPFIIALNKIDLLYGWKKDCEKDVEEVIKKQDAFTQQQFEKRCNDIIIEFAEQELNVALYYQNPDSTEYFSMIPTSARSSDGMGTLIAQIIEKCQTTLSKRITYSDELQATVMEVKTGDGIGTTIDVALIGGCLSVGDKIVVAGQEGPIVTRIRRILIPESNQELRVTNHYQTKGKVQGACGIKILAKDLEKAMAGFPLFVVRNDDEIDEYKHELETMLKTALDTIELKEKGVYVQASTLGSLEAFLQLLKTARIPCSGVNIGSVHRKDVMRASAQLGKDIEWATILAFDVRIERDTQDYAKSIDVKIFQSNEIYHLRDIFITYHEELKKINRDKYRHLAVFPCKFKILSQYIFHSRDPIVCGVRVEDGSIRLGTPICVPSKDFIELGRVVAIEKNHKSLEIAEKDSEVCIKIESIPGETPKMFGRHFNENDLLVSKISRESIDILKAYFRDVVRTSDWKLIVDLKRVFDIV